MNVLPCRGCHFLFILSFCADLCPRRGVPTAMGEERDLAHEKAGAVRLPVLLRADVPRLRGPAPVRKVQLTIHWHYTYLAEQQLEV